MKERNAGHATGGRDYRASTPVGYASHAFSCATEFRHVSLFTDASRYIPGGVNSPVRAFRAVGGEPIFVERASGAYVFGDDGRRYIDYVGSWGPMILGHGAHRAARSGVPGRHAVG